MFFYADYCKPCHRFDELYIVPIELQVGSDKVKRINAVDQPQKANKFGINRLPSVVLIDSDEVVSIFSYPPDTNEVSKWLRGCDDKGTV